MRGTAVETSPFAPDAAGASDSSRPRRDSTATGSIGRDFSPRSVAAARRTASTTFTYPVSRSRIPLSASRISPSEGSGFASRSALVASTIAPVEYPDCIAPASTKASWIGWSSPVATLSDSTVVISWPAAWAASSTSADTSRPSTRTAAAPVSPVLDPKRTLKHPRPRNTASSEVPGAQETVCLVPFTVSLRSSKSSSGRVAARPRLVTVPVPSSPALASLTAGPPRGRARSARQRGRSGTRPSHGSPREA